MQYPSSEYESAHFLHETYLLSSKTAQNIAKKICHKKAATCVIVIFRLENLICGDIIIKGAREI